MISLQFLLLYMFAFANSVFHSSPKSAQTSKGPTARPVFDHEPFLGLPGFTHEYQRNNWNSTPLSGGAESIHFDYRHHDKAAGSLTQLRYEVKTGGQVHSLDHQATVHAVECKPDALLLSLSSEDWFEVHLPSLQERNFVIGGSEWGCLGPTGEAEPFYRQILFVVSRPALLKAEVYTTPASFSQVFPKLEVHFEHDPLHSLPDNPSRREMAAWYQGPGVYWNYEVNGDPSNETSYATEADLPLGTEVLRCSHCYFSLGSKVSFFFDYSTGILGTRYLKVSLRLGGELKFGLQHRFSSGRVAEKELVLSNKLPISKIFIPLGFLFTVSITSFLELAVGVSLDVELAPDDTLLGPRTSYSREIIYGFDIDTTADAPFKTVVEESSRFIPPSAPRFPSVFNLTATLNLDVRLTIETSMFGLLTWPVMFTFQPYIEAKISHPASSDLHCDSNALGVAFFYGVNLIFTVIPFTLYIPIWGEMKSSDWSCLQGYLPYEKSFPLMDRRPMTCAYCQGCVYPLQLLGTATNPLLPPLPLEPDGTIHGIGFYDLYFDGSGFSVNNANGNSVFLLEGNLTSSKSEAPLLIMEFNTTVSFSAELACYDFGSDNDIWTWAFPISASGRISYPFSPRNCTYTLYVPAATYQVKAYLSTILRQPVGDPSFNGNLFTVSGSLYPWEYYFFSYPHRNGCSNIPGWTDSYGSDCAYYDDYPDQCGPSADAWINDGYTANDICCSCGGGTGCSNIAGWTDIDGYGCTWYDADPDARCGSTANQYINNGYTANHVCCSCGGGTPKVSSKKIIDCSNDESVTGAAINITVVYKCPGGCASSSKPVWGCSTTGYYTRDSGICKAAIHAGIITDAEGGLVAVTRAGSISPFCSSTKNGVSTSPYSGPFPAMLLAPVDAKRQQEIGLLAYLKTTEGDADLYASATHVPSSADISSSYDRFPTLETSFWGSDSTSLDSLLVWNFGIANFEASFSVFGYPGSTSSSTIAFDLTIYRILYFDMNSRRNIGGGLQGQNRKWVVELPDVANVDDLEHTGRLVMRSSWMPPAALPHRWLALLSYELDVNGTTVQTKSVETGSFFVATLKDLERQGVLQPINDINVVVFGTPYTENNVASPSDCFVEVAWVEELNLGALRRFSFTASQSKFFNITGLTDLVITNTTNVVVTANIFCFDCSSGESIIGVEGSYSTTDPLPGLSSPSQGPFSEVIPGILEAKLTWEDVNDGLYLGIKSNITQELEVFVAVIFEINTVDAYTSPALPLGQGNLLVFIMPSWSNLSSYPVFSPGEYLFISVQNDDKEALGGQLDIVASQDGCDECMIFYRDEYGDDGFYFHPRPNARAGCGQHCFCFDESDICINMAQDGLSIMCAAVTEANFKLHVEKRAIAPVQLIQGDLTAAAIRSGNAYFGIVLGADTFVETHVLDEEIWKAESLTAFPIRSNTSEWVNKVLPNITVANFVVVEDRVLLVDLPAVPNYFPAQDEVVLMAVPKTWRAFSTALPNLTIFLPLLPSSSSSPSASASASNSPTLSSSASRSPTRSSSASLSASSSSSPTASSSLSSAHSSPSFSRSPSLSASSSSSPTASSSLASATCSPSFSSSPSLSASSSSSPTASRAGHSELPACSMPSILPAGYDTSACQAGTVQQCSLSCLTDAGYSGIPFVGCNSDGEKFSFWGCVVDRRKCRAAILPWQKGYKWADPSTCNASEFNIALDCPASCDEGYHGSARVSCPVQNGTFVLQGCSREINICYKPPLAKITAYDVKFCPDNVPVSSCTVTCKKGAVGEAVVDCPLTSSEFVMTGCAEEGAQVTGNDPKPLSTGAVAGIAVGSSTLALALGAGLGILYVAKKKGASGKGAAASKDSASADVENQAELAPSAELQTTEAVTAGANATTAREGEGEKANVRDEAGATGEGSGGSDTQSPSLELVH